MYPPICRAASKMKNTRQHCLNPDDRRSKEHSNYKFTGAKARCTMQNLRVHCDSLEYLNLIKLLKY